MKARLCDRCKDFYEEVHDFKGDIFRIKKVSQTASRYERSLDLCPKCTKELGEWMQEGMKK